MAISDTIDRMAAFPEKLLALLEGAEPEALTYRPGPEEWSVVEVIGHLDDVDALMRGRIEAAQASDTPEVTVYKEHNAIVERDFQNQPFETVLKNFLAGRESFLEMMRALTPEQLQRGVRHPMHGFMSSERIPASLPKHDLTHYNQIAGNLALYAFEKRAK
jgi:hypothetical protein